jgi:CheY-like chemotaxis protein
VAIILPHAALLTSTTERKAALRQISAEHYALHGDATILLVEDDEHLRPITAQYLRDLNYEVVEAGSAEAALAMFHAMDRVDLVITDLNLPGEDGVMLARRLGAAESNLPVLFATGRHGVSEDDTGRILQKPYSDTALAKAVLNSLGRQVIVEPSVAEPMLSRMTSAGMRSFLMAWYAAKAEGEGYPRIAVLDPEDYGLGRHAFTAEIANTVPPTFRYLKLGSTLSAELAKLAGDGVAVTGDASLDETEIIGTLDAAYRRCARTRSPVFQSAEYEFGDGRPFHFERLILPAAYDGQTITHLIGIVLIRTDTQRE